MIQGLNTLAGAFTTFIFWTQLPWKLLLMLPWVLGGGLCSSADGGFGSCIVSMKFSRQPFGSGPTTLIPNSAGPQGTHGDYV